MGILPIREAMSLAEGLGLRTSIVARPEIRRIPFSVAVTSVDPAPTVSVRRGRFGTRASDMYLGERDQFGPDSWDYPATISEAADRYYLRLDCEGRTLDIPFLSTSAIVLSAREWPTQREVQAGIAIATLTAAFEELGVSPAAMIDGR